MKKPLTNILMLLVAWVIITHIAHAQSTQPGCPAGITNPLQILAGTWTFSMNGFTSTPVSATVLPPLTSAGQFAASVGTRAGVQIGLLNLIQTSSQNGQITRQEKDIGSYQILPDCSGGTLTFNFSSRPVSFDFWFSKGTSTPIFAGSGSGACSGKIRFNSNRNADTLFGDAEQVICDIPGFTCLPTFANATECTCHVGLTAGVPVPSGCPSSGGCFPTDPTTSCGMLIAQKPSCHITPGPSVPGSVNCNGFGCFCEIIP